jgi:hypothetical protein
MLKKKINIILLIVVLGVWGAILYKIANGYFLKSENILATNSSTHLSRIKIIQKDTFELIKPKRDPFLDKENLEKDEIVVSKPKKTSYASVSPKTSFVVNIPTIRYFGYITTENLQSTALLSINNKKIKLALNQEYKGIKLILIQRDSIKVIFNKQTKVIKKQK